VLAGGEVRSVSSAGIAYAAAARARVTNEVNILIIAVDEIRLSGSRYRRDIVILAKAVGMAIKVGWEGVLVLIYILAGA